MLGLLLILSDAAAPIPSDFNLANVKPAETGCGAGPRPGEVVVCGKAAQTDRIPRLPDEPVPLLPRADVSILGNLRGSIAGQQTGVGGFVSNRIMATVKLKF
jgi:hypothetical protein